MLTAFVATLHAVAAVAGPAVTAALPVIGAAAASFVIISAHKPELDPIALRGDPEVALQCVQTRIAAHPGGFVTLVQPLYGTGTYSIVLKRGGVTGDPVMTGIVHQTSTGSAAEFRSLAAGTPDAEGMAQIISGC